MADEARTGEESAKGYRACYDTGYKTDVDRIVIAGNRLTFRRGDAAATAT